MKRRDFIPDRHILDGVRVFNVRAYGATGDGKTYDHPAIQAAIAAACAEAGTGTRSEVYLPIGTYNCVPRRRKQGA